MKNKKDYNKKSFYKIVKIIRADSVGEALKNEKKAEITEVFRPDTMPAYLENK